MSYKIKEEKMYILYANASYYNTVCAAVDSINKFSDIPITVYMLNDHREVPGANAIYWECDIEDVPKGEYINRDDSRIYNLLIQRPLIVKHALENFANTVCYIDSDSIATQYVDSIFDMYLTNSWYPYFTEGIYDYLHNNGKGGADSRDDLSTTLEHPACELFNINQYVRNKYRQTGYFVAGQNTINFLNEWSWMCNHPNILQNPQHYAPYHEETILNVLLYKYNLHDGLPYIYTNAGLDKLYRIYEEDNWGKHVESWFRLPENKEQLLFLHGEKDPSQMSKIMSKIMSKMSKSMSKPIKIMYLAPHLSTGGMPQFLLKRIEALEQYSNADIFVVEYQCYSLDFVVQRNKIKKLSRLSTLYEDKMELFKIIEDFNPDIIHIDEMSERLDRQMITKLYSPDRKYRIVETCHDVSFDPGSKIFIPDSYAFCTPYHLDTFVDLDKIYNQVVEYPIDKQEVSNTLKRQYKELLGMSLSSRHVINVGLWTPGKNQKEGLKIARKYPKVMFHFIGNQAGNFEDYWKPLMKNLPKNVKIWGERNDIHHFMLAADVFMFNSTWECNPIVLKEAVSYGLPIIAKNLPQYKDMYSRYIAESVDLNSPVLGLLMQYNVPTDNTSEDFANANINLYDKTMSVIPSKKCVNDYNIIQNFVGQPFLEITGTSTSTFVVEFYDGEKLVHHDTIKCNHWIKLSREYYTKWETRVYKDGTLVYTNVLDYTDKRVYIAFDSSSLGDTIAWMPYVLEFKKKHACKVIVSTFKNFLFESEYPELEFVDPGTAVNNIYGMYKIGWFYNDHKEPVLPNTIPLQQTATNILGLDYIEIKPRIIKIPSRHTGNKYIAIATNSTSGCKFWTKEAWQEVINYLHDKDYNVINVSLEENPFDNCIVLADKSMISTMECISNSQFFIGLSSGLSWAAWAIGKEVIMISNFTEANHEFSCYRPVNKNVCHGCWNDPQYKFDKSNWTWCPINEGTENQFICQRSITSEMVINEIKKLL